MWREALAGVLVFALTTVESFTASRERSYEALAYVKERGGVSVPLTTQVRMALRSSNWSVAFEAVIVADMILAVETSPWVLLAALPGAKLGQAWSVLSRIKGRKRSWRAFYAEYRRARKEAM